MEDSAIQHIQARLKERVRVLNYTEVVPQREFNDRNQEVIYHVFDKAAHHIGCALLSSKPSLTYRMDFDKDTVELDYEFSYIDRLFQADLNSLFTNSETSR